LLFVVSACNDNETNLTETDPSLTSMSVNAKTVDGTGTSSVQAYLTNGNMESNTVGYWRGGTTFTGFSFDYSSTESVSPSHSLSIVASNALDKNFTYWLKHSKPMIMLVRKSR